MIDKMAPRNIITTIPNVFFSTYVTTNQMLAIFHNDIWPCKTKYWVH